MGSSCSSARCFLNRIAIAASTLALFSMPYAARAQSTPEGGQQYSSSADWKSYFADFDGAPAGGGHASPQYGQNNRYPDYTSKWSHLAFEAGVGPTAPIGNDVKDGADTWGYNFTFGAGWNFTKRIGTMLEYQFDKQKIPGSTLTQIAEANSTGVPIGGNINTWSLTIDPIIYQPFTKSYGGYITGGGGFYRKVTNFTEPVEACDIFFCSFVPETVAHSSSNQGGLNLGIGFYWKAFGEDSSAKLYAESRYVWVNSPVSSPSDPFGEGTEGLIPVTFGVRF